jgi:hypothetical protein
VVVRGLGAQSLFRARHRNIEQLVHDGPESVPGGLG